LRDLSHRRAFTAYEQLRRDRVTRIIKMAARTNSHKAAGPITRRLREVIMPIADEAGKTREDSVAVRPSHRLGCTLSLRQQARHRV
jgi:2-polyprenyl-6-methoxyphenol hydroxylase-like FAD-dependent oxidoreductase